MALEKSTRKRYRVFRVSVWSLTHENFEMVRLFRKKQNLELKKVLLHILQENLRYVESSEDSDWSEMNVAEISNQLKKSIFKIERGKLPQKFLLHYLFSPTGPLQETAIANGWADQYIELSTQFDKIMKELG